MSPPVAYFYQLIFAIGNFNAVTYPIFHWAGRYRAHSILESAELIYARDRMKALKKAPQFSTLKTPTRIWINIEETYFSYSTGRAPIKLDMRLTHCFA